PGSPSARLENDASVPEVVDFPRVLWLEFFPGGRLSAPGADVLSGIPLGKRLCDRWHRQCAGIRRDADHDRLHGICLYRIQRHSVLELAAAPGTLRGLRFARGHCRSAVDTGSDRTGLSLARQPVDIVDRDYCDRDHVLRLGSPWGADQRQCRRAAVRARIVCRKGGDLFYGGTLMLGLAIPAWLVWT